MLPSQPPSGYGSRVNVKWEEASAEVRRSSSAGNVAAAAHGQDRRKSMGAELLRVALTRGARRDIWSFFFKTNVCFYLCC